MRGKALRAFLAWPPSLPLCRSLSVCLVLFCPRTDDDGRVEQGPAGSEEGQKPVAEEVEHHLSRE